jgi:preprotein translocase subunit SecG
MFPIVIKLLLAIHVIVSVLIILLVLMQRPKNEGLGAAFGGGMTENLFGAQGTNALQTITRWLAGIFFSLTLLLSWLYVKENASHSTLQQRLSAPTTIPATPAPVIPKDVPTSLPLPEAATPPVSLEDAAKPAEAAKTPPEAPAPPKPEAPTAPKP